MPSFFDNVMTSCGPLVMRCVSRVVTSYTTADNSSTASVVLAVGEIEEREEISPQGGKIKIRRRTFAVLKDAASVSFKGIADVHLRGWFTIDGESWSVESITNETASEIHGTLISQAYTNYAPRGVHRGF